MLYYWVAIRNRIILDLNGDWTFDLKGDTLQTELLHGLAFVRPLLAQTFK